MKVPLMKTSVIAVLAVSLVLLPCAYNKPTYVLQQANHEVKAPLRASPKVSAYDCTRCVWNDGVNYVCIDHSVDVKLGWEFE